MCFACDTLITLHAVHVQNQGQIYFRVQTVQLFESVWVDMTIQHPSSKGVASRIRMVYT